MQRLQRLFLLTLVLFTSFAYTMTDLPRNMSLKAFDPHREAFVCQYEADAVPPIDPQAEQWLQEGMAATSYALRPKERDYARAAQLWQQAADRKHWKAMLNLASLYAHGRQGEHGVPRDTERSVRLTEAAMKLGIPGAFDLMGTFHMEGTGVKQNASRAFALWELAADMGSPAAQGYLGAKMTAIYDDPKSGFWGNRKVGLTMLECGVAQGNGKAAYELGVTLEGTRQELDEDNKHALQVLHEGVKFGNDDCASYLAATFDEGSAMVNHIVDEARGIRYSELGRAMRYNRDLRFPNLDKVLPLPPAQLPKWDGDVQTLVDAAKGVVPASVIEATPGAKLTGRAHIPDGWRLPSNPLPPHYEAFGTLAVPPQYEATPARFSGCWLAQLLDVSESRHEAWNRAQTPLRYAQRETFEQTRDGLMPRDGRVMWHYMGVPVQQAVVADHPKVGQGIARYTRIPEPRQRCQGDVTCTQTGIWHASIYSEHPLARTYNTWNRQAYVEKGAAFPKPAGIHLAIESSEVTWLWLGNANVIDNALGDTGFAHISLDDVSTTGADKA